MATANTFTGTPRVDSGNPITADTSFSAPVAAVLCFTAGASGSRVHRIDIALQAGGAAETINIFLYDGSNYRLLRSVGLANVTIAAGTPPSQATINFGGEGLILPGTSGYNRIYAATYGGIDAIVTVNGGDF